ncbi:alginate export family protein [Tardiphaga robiniae]|nr:alginate export family protein [Tardiphaga robiniae]
MSPQTKHWVPSSLSVVFLGMVATPALAQTPCPAPPSYQLLRQDEDYSYLRDTACRREPLDAIKFIPLNALGDQYLTLGGEAREWYEGFRNANWGAGPQDSNGYLLQRLSSYADLHLGNGIRLFGQVSSAIESGRNGGPRPIDEDRLWVEEAFAEIKLPVLSNGDVAFRVGRQQFQFGSGRLVDVREGPNVRLAFDGFSAILDDGPWHATAFVTQPVLNRPQIFDDPTDRRTTFWGLYSTRTIASIGGGLDLYYLGINNREATFDRDAGREIRHTLGARVFGRKGHWDYDWELSYQAGSFAGLPLSAYGFGADTGYSFDSLRFAPRVSVRAGATSGDSGRAGGSFGTFSPLFPSGIYFGQAAISLNGPSNMLRLGGSLQAHLTPSVQVGIDFDWFWRNSLDDGVYGLGVNLLRSGNDNRERYIGSQPSASVKWHATPHLDLSMAYAYFAAGPFLTHSATPGRNVQYLSAVVDYKF